MQIATLVTDFFGANCCIVWQDNRDDCIVIDAGDNFETIQEKLTKIGRKPLAVLSTHGHLDHVGAVKPLCETYDIAHFLHKSDEFLLPSIPEMCRAFSVPILPIPEVHRNLHDNQMLSLAGFDIEVRHTPGHSPGSCIFIIEDKVFTGDTLFQLSIGRHDLPGGDGKQLLKSIRERIFDLDNQTIVIPGHGGQSSVGFEKENNPFLN